MHPVVAGFAGLAFGALFAFSVGMPMLTPLFGLACAIGFGAFKGWKPPRA
jgi:hypothetical protein